MLELELVSMQYSLEVKQEKSVMFEPRSNGMQGKDGKLNRPGSASSKTGSADTALTGRHPRAEERSYGSLTGEKKDVFRLGRDTFNTQGARWQTDLSQVTPSRFEDELLASHPSDVVKSGPADIGTQLDVRSRKGLSVYIETAWYWIMQIGILYLLLLGGTIMMICSLLELFMISFGF